MLQFAINMKFSTLRF